MKKYLFLRLLVLLYTLFFAAVFPTHVLFAATKNTATKVKASSPLVNLGFEEKGRIVKVYVNIGDRVAVGDPLAELDSGDVAAQIQQAEAVVQLRKAEKDDLLQQQSGVNQAGMNQAMAGSILEDLKLQNAKADVDAARQGIVDAIQDAYMKSEDAVRNKADQFFVTPRTSPQVIFYNYNPQLQFDLPRKRSAIEAVLVSWKASADVLTSSDDISSAADSATANLAQVKDFMETTAAVINSVNSDPSVSLLTLHNWRNDVYTGRTNIITVAKNLSSAKGKLRDTMIKLSIAQYQRDHSTQKGTSIPQTKILLQDVRIRGAEANLNALKVRLRKFTLRSPVRGVIKAQNAKLGMIITGPSTVVSVEPFSKKSSTQKSATAN